MKIVENELIIINEKINIKFRNQSKRPPAIKSSSSSAGFFYSYFFFLSSFFGSSFYFLGASALGAEPVDAAGAGPDAPICLVPSAIS